jgi:hypothetical protein
MKLFVPTPTCKSTRYTRNTPLLALLDRLVPFRRRTHPIIQLGTGGFSFGIFAPVGALQPKEAVIENMGHYLLGSKSQFNFFKKEF